MGYSIAKRVKWTTMTQQMALYPMMSNTLMKFSMTLEDPDLTFQSRKKKMEKVEKITCCSFWKASFIIFLSLLVISAIVSITVLMTQGNSSGEKSEMEQNMEKVRVLNE